MFRELEPVVLSREFTEHGLSLGDVGAVVTLSKADIRPMRREEILHVRNYAVAG